MAEAPGDPHASCSAESCLSVPWGSPAVGEAPDPAGWEQSRESAEAESRQAPWGCGAGWGAGVRVNRTGRTSPEPALGPRPPHPPGAGRWEAHGRGRPLPRSSEDSRPGLWAPSTALPVGSQAPRHSHPRRHRAPSQRQFAPWVLAPDWGLRNLVPDMAWLRLHPAVSRTPLTYLSLCLPIWEMGQPFYLPSRDVRIKCDTS